MPRAGLSRDAVVDLAVELADGSPGALERLTLAAVAARAGVAVPSLYKHVGSLADLRVGIALVGVRELGRRAAAATVGRSGEDALRALAGELRTFAREHPGLYAASQEAASENPDVARAQADAVEVIAAVLRGFDIPDAARIDGVRAVRSALHGFIDLEARGGFGLPDDLDRSFEVMVALLCSGVASFAVLPAPAP